MSASGVSVGLELALFEADHGDPAAAVDAARDEWRRRQSDPRGRRLRVGPPRGGPRPRCSEVRSTGPGPGMDRRPRVLYHAGIDPARARRRGACGRLPPPGAGDEPVVLRGRSDPRAPHAGELEGRAREARPHARDPHDRRVDRGSVRRARASLGQLHGQPVQRSAGAPRRDPRRVRRRHGGDPRVPGGSFHRRRRRRIGVGGRAGGLGRRPGGAARRRPHRRGGRRATEPGTRGRATPGCSPDRGASTRSGSRRPSPPPHPMEAASPTRIGPATIGSGGAR